MLRTLVVLPEAAYSNLVELPNVNLEVLDEEIRGLQYVDSNQTLNTNTNVAENRYTLGYTEKC